MLLVGALLVIGCTSPSIIATQSIQNGDAMNNANRYDEAIASYEKYLEVSPQLGLYRNPAQEADVCRKLAHAYSTQGHYDRAVDYLREAIARDSTLGNNLELIEDTRQLGTVYNYMGRYPEAMTSLNRALALNDGMDKSIKDTRRLSVADTHLSLAQLHLSVGNYTEAEAHAHDALRLYENINGEYVGIIESKLILGIIHRDESDLEKSLSFLGDSRSLAQNNDLSTARQDQSIGEVYLIQGDLDQAAKYKLSALEEAKKSKIKPQIVMANMRLGDLYQQFGDEKKADAYYREALSIQSEMGGESASVNPSLELRLGDVKSAYDHFLRSGSQMGTALTCLRLGEMRYKSGDLDSAGTLYNQAETYFEDLGSREGLARVKFALAKVKTQQKEYTPARALLDACASLTLQPEFQWQIDFQRGLIQEGMGHIDSAIIHYREAIESIESMRSSISVDEFRTLYTNNKMQVYDHLIMLLLSLKTPLGTLELSDATSLAYTYCERARSRTFLDMLGNRKLHPKNEADEDLLEQEQLLRLKIQRLAKELNQTEDDAMADRLLAELEEAQSEHVVLTQRVKLSNAAYATMINVAPPSLPEIQSVLDDHTVLVEYWVGEEGLAVWAVTSDGITARTLDVRRDQMSREVTGCRRAINLRVQDQTEVLLGSLYQQLIAPVEEVVGNYSHIVFAPHGALHFLPFHALRDSKGKYLIERFSVNYSPSGSVMAYCRGLKPAQGNDFLGAALGDTPIGEFSGLPGTRIEVSQLGQLYTRFDSLMGRRFTESLLKSNSDHYNYLHIATHGTFNNIQPMYSYLLMSPSDDDDGRLTVDEIFDMNVQARLVTLSACETGLGELVSGDELTGMSRAFIYAGAPAVIVSLWQVDDASTAWLMTRFYQYVQSGMDEVDALAAAQRDFITGNFTVSQSSRALKPVTLDPAIQEALQNRRSASSRSPYFWAPFVFIGTSR